MRVGLKKFGDDVVDHVRHLIITVNYTIRSLISSGNFIILVI